MTRKEEYECAHLYSELFVVMNKMKKMNAKFYSKCKGLSIFISIRAAEKLFLIGYFLTSIRIAEVRRAKFLLDAHLCAHI